MRLAVGLPNLHPGKGSPIGAAFAVEGYLYPTVVGNDIGCGIGLWRSELSAKKLKREAWADRLRNLDNAWAGDAREFLSARAIEPSGFEHSLGTIGSGNHFAELQAMETRIPKAAIRISGEAVYLCVHSGSRGFGEAILRDHVAQFGSDGLAVESGEATQYLSRHNHAKRWASANRELIAARVFERLRTKGTCLVDICHNWVEQVDLADRPCQLHRKGAAPSTAGPVVIPGSRGAFTYLVAPRDAGRQERIFGGPRRWTQMVALR